MDIKRFRKKYHLSNADIVRVIQYKYPKFCKYALCMATNPKEYGVQLTHNAEIVLMAAVSKKKDNRKKNHQLTVRVDDSTFNALRFCCEMESKTAQDFIEGIIIGYCYGSRKRWQSMTEE